MSYSQHSCYQKKKLPSLFLVQPLTSLTVLGWHWPLGLSHCCWSSGGRLVKVGCGGAMLLCMWVSWLQPRGFIRDLKQDMKTWVWLCNSNSKGGCGPQPDFLSATFSLSFPTPRVPLTKFRSIRRQLTDSGRKVEELLAGTHSPKYNYGFPASGAPTPEALKNYLDVSRRTV